MLHLCNIINDCYKTIPCEFSPTLKYGKRLLTEWLVCLLNAAPNQEKSPTANSSLTHSLTRRAETRGNLVGGSARARAGVRARDHKLHLQHISMHWYWFLEVLLLLLVSESSIQEAKTIEEGRGSRSFSAGRSSCYWRGRGAEDRQECPRSREPLSTDKSLIKPYGRYLRGTRTSLRSVRALMDLYGKYDFVFFGAFYCFSIGIAQLSWAELVKVFSMRVHTCSKLLQ